MQTESIDSESPSWISGGVRNDVASRKIDWIVGKKDRRTLKGLCESTSVIPFAMKVSFSVVSLEMF